MTSTEPTQSDSHLIKTDTVGRLRTPADRRQQLLEEFERSGLSAARFAALAGIKYTTFAAWRQRQRKQKAPDAHSQPQEKPVHSLRWLEAVL